MNANKRAQLWRESEPYNHKIALLWRDCRRDAEMSLKDVAAVTNMRVSYLSDFERGRITPPADLLAQLFHAIGYTLEITAKPIDDNK